ncbi:MAG: DUF2155 domain-containing protein [Alphaproteobacteria bacterium]|nr:DUF2155 domain-containing protein [Alphaproteobacteria bacterium]
MFNCKLSLRGAQRATKQSSKKIQMLDCFALLAMTISVFIAFNSAFADEFIDRNTAVVRVMNKAAGKAQTLQMHVGKTSEFEKLSIAVRSCKQTAPYSAENFYMFAEIRKGDAKVFSGWMDRNEPGDNPLQDADYDLWLVKCE